MSSSSDNNAAGGGGNGPQDQPQSMEVDFFIPFEKHLGLPVKKLSFVHGRSPWTTMRIFHSDDFSAEVEASLPSVKRITARFYLAKGSLDIECREHIGLACASLWKLKHRCEFALRVAFSSTIPEQEKAFSETLARVTEIFKWGTYNSEPGTTKRDEDGSRGFGIGQEYISWM